MLLAALELLRDNPQPDVDAIRDALGSNLCRCTGYQNILNSVVAAGRSMATASASTGETQQ